MPGQKLAELQRLGVRERSRIAGCLAMRAVAIHVHAMRVTLLVILGMIVGASILLFLPPTKVSRLGKI